MGRLQRSLLPALAAGACVLASWSGWAAEKSPESSPDHRYVVLLLDNSFSMYDSRAASQAMEAAQLLTGMVAPADRLSVVTFAEDGRVVVPLEAVSTMERRKEIQEKIADIGFGGGTNFRQGLSAVATALAKTDASPEATSIIVLSDGQHSTGGAARNVIPGLLPFVRDGFAVHTLSLGAPQQAVLLEKISELTGGVHLRLDQPQDILASLIALTGLGSQYWVYNGKLNKQFDVQVRTPHLVVIGRKQDGKGRIADVGPVRGQAPGDKRILKYDGRHFAMQAITAPPAGSYRVETEKGLQDGVVLMRPPYSLRVHKSSNLEVFEGQLMQLVLAVALPGDLPPELLNVWRAEENVYVDAAVIRQKTGETIDVVRLQVDPQAGGARQVLLKSRPVALPIDSSQNEQEPYLLEVLAELRPQDSGVNWSRRLEVPAAALAEKAPERLEVARKSVDFGVRWQDAGPAEGLVGVEALGDGMKVQTRSSNPAVTLSPDSFTLDAGAKQDVRYRVDFDQADPGAVEATVAFTARSASTDRLLPQQRVSVSGQVYRLQAETTAGKIPLSSAEAGAISRTELPIQVMPQSEVRLQASPLTGPGGVPLQTSVADDTATLTVRIPDDAQPGTYSGELTVALPQVEALAPRTLPIELAVKAPAAGLKVEPEQITVTSDRRNVWENKALKLRFSNVAPAQLQVKPSSLQGVNNAFGIMADFEISVEPETGWDGSTLEPGKPRTLTYKVYVSSDLPNDTYKGKLTLQAVREGKTLDEVEVPVSVTVKRGGE